MGNPSYVAYAELQMEEIKKRKVDFPATDEEVAKVIEQLKPFDLSLNQDKLCDRPLLFGMVPKIQLYLISMHTVFMKGSKQGMTRQMKKLILSLTLRLGIRSAEKECLRQRTGSRNIYCLLCKMLKYSLKICYDAYTDIMMKVTN